MEITDIRVKLIHESKERLRAVCSVTFDDEFVVRDIKVVDGTNGTFVAMPSRKLSVHCPKCRHKNQIRARYCNECGGKLPPARPPEDGNGRSRFHRDIAHPINTEFRELIHGKVLEAFENELNNSSDEARYDESADSEDAQIETASQDKRVDAAEPSEYDSLIAGLNTGSRGRSPQSEEKRQSRDTTHQKRRSDRPARHARSSSDKTEKAGAQQGEPVFEGVCANQSSKGKTETQTCVAEVTDENEDTQFGADIETTPSALQRSNDDSPHCEVSNERPSSTDEDDGFGAGIL